MGLSHLQPEFGTVLTREGTWVKTLYRSKPLIVLKKVDVNDVRTFFFSEGLMTNEHRAW